MVDASTSSCDYNMSADGWNGLQEMDDALDMGVLLVKTAR